MKSILVVDDMTGVRDAMTVLLEVAGYRVRTAENGSDGARLAMAEQFDLIISDILMPELDGTEMIMKLRESRVKTPVLAVSAGGNGVGADTALSLPKDLGVTTLEKPFSKSELLDTVNSILHD